MIQCCICEDWYHDNHLDLSTPVPTDFEEMICKECVKQHMFLFNYRPDQATDKTDTPGIQQEYTCTTIVYMHKVVCAYHVPWSGLGCTHACDKVYQILHAANFKTFYVEGASMQKIFKL